MKQKPTNPIFSNRDLIHLVIPLVIELALKLVVGLLDSIMVPSVGEAAVSGVSLIDSVFQLLIYIFAALAAGGAIVAGQRLGGGGTSAITANAVTQTLASLEVIPGNAIQPGNC